MLSVKNISFRVGNKILLDNISADFSEGKLNLIIGPNGAGKSTLIKIICNQIAATSGSVIYDNKAVQEFSLPHLARIRAVLSQNIEIAFPLTVNEVVQMGRYSHFTGKPSEKDIRACEEAMQFFDVANLADRNYMTLSGGEKQRVHFARVLSQIWYSSDKECKYLFLDEPLTFLDVRYQFEFMNKIIQFMKDHRIVIIGVVHDLNLASRFADNILLLHQGKLFSQGPAEQVLTIENIKAVYGLEPVIHIENGRSFLFFR